MEKSAREPVTVPTADAAPRTTNLCGNLVASAFVSEVQTRPCPTFGRSVHLGFPHRLRPGTSPQALRIPPRGGHPALRTVGAKIERYLKRRLWKSTELASRMPPALPSARWTKPWGCLETPRSSKPVEACSVVEISNLNLSAVSEAPPTQRLNSQLFARERFRYSTKTSQY
jgi:hypothetical protein